MSFKVYLTPAINGGAIEKNLNQLFQQLARTFGESENIFLPISEYWVITFACITYIIYSLAEL